MTVKPTGNSPIQQSLSLEQVEESQAQIPEHRSSVESQPETARQGITEWDRGRRVGESRIEGEARRAALEERLPRFSNYHVPTRSPGREDVRHTLLQQAHATPAAPAQLAAPRAPRLPNPEYDYRNVSGGGIFSRGPNEVLQGQHAANMRAAGQYAGRYERYADEYIRRVRNAGSFEELQRLGSPRPPQSMHVGERGQAESVRQQQEMRNLREEMGSVNGRTGQASQRMFDEVANRARQLSGREAHGPNARLELTLDTPVGELHLNRTVDQDGPRDSMELSHEGQVRLGRYFRAHGEISSNGEASGEVSVRAPGARVSLERTMNLRGEQETNVEVGVGTRNTGVTVNAGSDSHLGINVTQRGIGAGAEVNPREGTFQQSVSIELPGTDHKLELSVGFRGISQEDAQRFAETLRGAPGFFDLPQSVIRAMDQNRDR